MSEKKKYFKNKIFKKKSCGKFSSRLDKQLPFSELWLKTRGGLSRSRTVTLLFSIFTKIAFGFT